MAFSCELWDCRGGRIIERNCPHATYGRSERLRGARRTENSRFSLSARCAAVSRPHSLSLLGGLSSCVEEPPDWQLHMCRCNYGPANWQRGAPGHCHYWHTGTTPHTRRWRERSPSSQGDVWRDKGGERGVCVNVDLPVWKDGRKAPKTRPVRLSCGFGGGRNGLLLFLSRCFWLHGHYCAPLFSVSDWQFP